MSKKAWLALIGISVVIILIFGAGVWLLTMGRGYGFGWGMMGRGMMFGYPFMGGIGMFLFWLLVIVGVVWLIQSSARGAGATGANAPASESPLDILKRRYAKGEITKEQFEEMKNTLGL